MPELVRPAPRQRQGWWWQSQHRVRGSGALLLGRLPVLDVQGVAARTEDAADIAGGVQTWHTRFESFVDDHTAANLGAGHAPEFLPQVRVSSAFPQDTAVARVQKSRWEHGHLATLAEELPGLLLTAIKTGKPALIVLAMDLLIPPVALYFLVLAAAWGMSLVAAMVWPVWQLAAVVGSLAALAFFVAIALAWWCFGRQLLSVRELLSTPVYALWKIPVYLAFFLRKRSGWVRTKRVTE